MRSKEEVTRIRDQCLEIIRNSTEALERTGAESYKESLYKTVAYWETLVETLNWILEE